MSKEVRIETCKEFIAIQEDKLKGLKERRALIEASIAAIEEDLERDRQELAELESSGGM